MSGELGRKQREQARECKAKSRGEREKKEGKEQRRERRENRERGANLSGRGSDHQHGGVLGVHSSCLLPARPSAVCLLLGVFCQLSGVC
jgi:hypothetical protein